MSETWLSSDVMIPPTFLPAYGVVSSPAQRSSSGGRPSGGLLLYYKRLFLINIVEIRPWWICIRTNLGSATLILCYVYFRPSLELGVILDEFQILMSHIIDNFGDAVIIVSGDFNSRVGEDFVPICDELLANTVISPVRSSHDAVCNCRGRQILGFMDSNGFCLLNGRSPGDIPASFTYVSKLGCSVIDLVWCSTGSLPCVNSLKVINDILISDHFPLLLQLSLLEPPLLTSSVNVRSILRWRDNCGSQYTTSLENSPQVHLDFPNTEALYDNMISTIFSAAKYCSMYNSVVTASRPQQSSWFDNECRDAKRILKHSVNKSKVNGFVEPFRSELIEQKLTYNRIVKFKKEQFSVDLVHKLIQSKSSSEFWSVINKFRPRRATHELPIPVWNAFYSDILPKKCVQYLDFSDPRHPDLDPEITFEELTATLNRCRNGKAPGLDQVAFEFIKGFPSNWLYYLSVVFNRILRDGVVPGEWTRIVLTMVFKRGSPEDPLNYRGIALLNCFAKVFTQVLLGRLSEWAERCNILPESQAGFRSGRSCSDNIFVLNSILHIHLRLRSRKVFAVFVDFRRAFDSIHHATLWSKLFSVGVSSQFIRVIKNLYDRATFQVRVGGHYSDSFDVPAGILQGEPLSPTLFALFLSDMEEFFRSRGLTGLDIDGYHDVIMLLYADDLIILSDSEISMRRKLCALRDYCHENALEVNIAKSKIMCFRSGGHVHSQFLAFWYDSERLQVVNEYTYLGVTFSSSALFLKNAQQVARKARTAISAVLQTLINAKSNSWNVQTELFDTIIINSLSYCSAIWSLKYTDVLERVQVTFFKKLLCLPVNTPDYMVRLETGRVKLAYLCFKLALDYLIKILYLPHNRLPFICLQRLLALDSGVSQLKRSNNWVSQIGLIFSEIGEESRWTPNNVQLLRISRPAVLESYHRYLHLSDIRRLTQSSYPLLYQHLQLSAQSASYLAFSLPIHVTRLISQIRLSALRCLRLLLPGVPYIVINTHLTCTICNLDQRETLEHLLLRCPAYQAYRPSFIRALTSLRDIATVLDTATYTTCRSLYTFFLTIAKTRNFILSE